MNTYCHRKSSSVPILLATVGFLWVGLTIAPAGAISVTMTIFPSLAPNYWAGPASWDVYLGRAMSAIENHSGPSGDPVTDPGAYRIIAGFLPGEIIVSGFHSWNGVATPAPPFNLEYGSRIHFGLHIVANPGSEPFRLANLWNDMNSNDVFNSLDNDGWYDTSVYNEYTTGIDWGGDGLRGTADDIRYFSGESPYLLVDELVYVGVGNAFDASASFPLPDWDFLTDQQKLDGITAYIQSVPHFSVYNKYCLYDDDGNPVNCVEYVPEPATWTLWLGGLAILLAARRLRRR